MNKVKYFVLPLILAFSFANLASAAILAELNYHDKSARLDILQMDVAIEDETNVIGLEKWSDNPAGLVLDEEKSRLVGVFESHEAKIKSLSSETTYKTTSPGVYSVFRGDHQAVSAQANFQRQTRSSTNQEDKQMAGQIRYNRLWDTFSFGAQAGLLDESSTQPGLSDTDYRSDPVKAGLGMGLKKNLSEGRLLFGLNVTQASYTQETAGANTDSDSTAVSLQTILQKSETFKAGVMATVTGSNVKSLTTETDTTQTELKTRGLVGSRQLPLRLGWEISLANIDSERDSSGLRTRESDTDAVLTTLGASWGTADTGLVGVEWESSNYDTTTNNFSPASQTTSELTIKYLTLGGELPLMKTLTLRGSYSLLDQESTSSTSSTTYEGYVLGAGLGIKLGSQAKIDLGLLHVTADNQTTPGNGDSDEDKIEVVGTLYFN
jgi:hypothetical protein